MASGAYLQSREPSAPFKILDMNVIPRGSAVSPQLGNNGRRSTTLKKANHIPNATNTFTDNRTEHLPPQREGSSAGQREKLSLMMRFARTKQNLRKKASALSCMGPQDVSATPRKVLEILVPKTDTVRGQGRGRGPTDPDIMTRERTPAEVGLVDIGNAAAPEKLVPAYRSTSTSISTANKLTKSEQNAGLLLSESRARSIRDVSQEPHDSAQPKPDPVPNDLSNAALIETSSPISISKLDSDAFDAALKLQSNNDLHDPSNTNSLNTLLIHSDAIFLPSVMESRTSSAVHSSGGKGTHSTSSQIVQIMRAVEADRDQLQAQHARMLEALRGAAREKIEYRDFIARLMQSHMEHEGRLMSAIAALQGECDRKSCEVERLRKAVAEKERVEEKLEQDV